jgi:hypothetical protein
MGVVSSIHVLSLGRDALIGRADAVSAQPRRTVGTYSGHPSIGDRNSAPIVRCRGYRSADASQAATWARAEAKLVEDQDICSVGANAVPRRALPAGYFNRMNPGQGQFLLGAKLGDVS